MVEQLQHVEEHADLRIALPDGCTLSARAWIPAGSESRPVPAILEYLPYRKSDGTAARDQIMHPYFAERGYACLRVDARGCGDSEGLFDDEYSEQELQDGVEIIHWIAAQPWCSGRVGMQGISWGGFNGLQIAARRPAPLKAVITIGSTVDRYADDIHYKGGVQLSENIGWAATAMSWFSMPPDPAVVGERWRPIWLQRLEHTPFLAATWLRHPDRDAYWRHGSVCEDYGAIEAAVLSLGGLHDGYRNTMSHLTTHLRAPVKGIAGPWNHKYPHISDIAPAIGYLQEAMRWWDHWLKDKPTGVDADPAYRAYIMDSAAPDAAATERAGRWVAEPRWPSPQVTPLALSLAPGGVLQSTPADGAPAALAEIAPDLACGQNCGEYFPFGFGPGELPEDQRHDNEHACCFSTEQLEQPLELLGEAALRLRLSCDQPRAQLVARLCDIRPDGSAMLIALGLLNLRHRDGFEQARDLVPGEAVDVELVLDHCAYRLPAGHRLCLALSSSYWPYCWPEPGLATLSLQAGELALPQRRAPEPEPPCHFEPPYLPPARRRVSLGPVDERKSRRREGDQVELYIESDDGGSEDLHSGIITHSKLLERWQIDHRDPLSARAEITWERSFGRGDWRVHSKLVSSLWGDAEHWHVSQTLQAWEDQELLFEKTFTDTVAR